ncbi:MAG TPA: hypothetical protein DDZ78_10005 [Porphyromonadaceae bacterium]|jgi:hypothetical protein|nr:hypothetical protein [Porphyromonadaceae bacterium]
MAGHFGFSYVGLMYLLMLFIPNVFWAAHQPAGYERIKDKEKKIPVLLERAGQVGVTACALVFTDFNLAPFSAWSVWLIVSFGCMLLYEVCWIRYFTGKHTLKDFYGPFLGIPLPLAVLPVAAFLLLGVYGKVGWMMLFAVLLGIGHIGIHANHHKEALRMASTPEEE